MSNFITIFPVDNGDQSLISIHENSYKTNILVDCNIRECSKDEEDPSTCDVKSILVSKLNKKALNKINDIPYVDVFILTHGDKDHLWRFENNFYCGAPENFKQKDKDSGKVLIDVMWFSPMVMGKCGNTDEECFNKEAKRRIRLHRDNNPAKDLPGNRIVIIGYDDDEDLDGLDLVRQVPGNVVKRFNERDLYTFSMFIHAPFKQQLAETEPNKNHTSIVFQARFKETASSVGFSTLAMFGGDSDYLAWNIILEKTINSGKDVTEQALAWDLFIAPHHCSWTFFNEHDNKKEVQESAKEVLRYRRKGGIVIASSKKILDNNDNPPSYLGKKEYIKMLEDKEHFLNTAVEPNEDKPEPIVFEITSKGPIRPPKSKVFSALTSAGGAGAAGHVVKQG